MVIVMVRCIQGKLFWQVVLVIVMVRCIQGKLFWQVVLVIVMVRCIQGKLFRQVALVKCASRQIILAGGIGYSYGPMHSRQIIPAGCTAGNYQGVIVNSGFFRREKKNSAPPSIRFFTDMSPWWNKTAFLIMARPSPVPPDLRLRPFSTL
jgi:hypothetical protein